MSNVANKTALYKTFTTIAARHKLIDSYMFPECTWICLKDSDGFVEDFVTTVHVWTANLIIHAQIIENALCVRVRARTHTHTEKERE